MLAGNINQIDFEKMPKILWNVLKFLKETDFNNKPVGQYTLDGDDLLYHVQEYDTLSTEDIEAEVHKKYCDVQFMVSGVEAIGWSPYQESIEFTQPYSEDNDIAMLKPLENESLIKMEKDFFALFTPLDIHRPRLNFNELKREKVKKIVMKLKKDRLYAK